MSTKHNESSFHYNFSANLSLKQDFSLKVQGSEAKVYEGKFLGKPSILKERFVKKYRHPDLDRTLTSERIKSEVRALNKCIEIGIRCPAVYFADLSSRCIVMQEIVGSTTVKQHLISVMEKHGAGSINELGPLARKIGEGIAKMHSNELVHGDLTTSNLLLKDLTGDSKERDLTGEEFEVYFIDFGLSKRDVTVEDMAVDLYVLERAISSSHPNSDKFYSDILQQYLKTVGDQSDSISAKLEEVKLRGRKRTMVG